MGAWTKETPAEPGWYWVRYPAVAHHPAREPELYEALRWHDGTIHWWVKGERGMRFVGQVGHAAEVWSERVTPPAPAIPRSDAGERREGESK